ncbi:MAG: DUF4340 domain-containing protein [Pirellulales bacterium]|nr:DUF4340 domain-containing protein [Pirellulales bacterium]
MNETTKTLTFVALAAVVALVVIFTLPKAQMIDPEDQRGKPLYPDFDDPLAVTGVEIVKYNEESAEVISFEVAQKEVKGKTRWVIPSHYDYPADAKDRVADAASALMGLRIFEVAGDQRGDQQEFGVVEPDPKKLRVGATGVGDRVVMRDAEGKTLLDLVIGKKARTDQDAKATAEQRYVRKVGENPIYVVELNTSALSTKFDDWIERNLLDIQSWDVRRLWLRDYSVDELNGALIQRGEIRVSYDDAGKERWKLIEDLKFAAGKWEPVKPAEDEELNTDKLNEMLAALDDLKIVDVSPKPAGLSADLKADADFINRDEAVESLARKGFFVAKLNDRVELFSNEGEVRVTMKDGVEYVLRFGEIATGSAPVETEKSAEGEPGKDADKGVNRYLFVMTEFNPEIIPKPQFEPLPDEAPSPQAAKEAPEQPKEAAAEGDSKKEGEEAKPDGAKSDEEKPAEPPAKTPAEIKIERERIEKDNQRKQDEYDLLVEEGKNRVAELNARFAGWYYVISNDVYKKIHLTRSELIKKKEKPAADKPAADAPTDAHDPGAFPDEVLDDLKNREKAK